MAEALSQDEINALIEAYTATGGAEDSSRASEKQVRIYDFARPDKFCKEHLRALNLIHAKHAASLGIVLSTMLRMEVQINLLAVDQLTYKEYCASVPEGTFFTEVSLEPLSSLAVFEFNPALVCACVDLLAGSSSISQVSALKITEIDKVVMKPVVEQTLRKYAEAWSKNMAFRPKITSMTTESTTRQVLLPSEPVLICGYEVNLEDHVSMMSICIPISSIEAALPALSGVGLHVSKRSEGDSEALKRTFEDVEVECKAVLGRISLPVSEITELEVGDLIPLPVRVDSLAELWVENVAVFEGKLGRSGNNLAVKVENTLAELAA